MALLAVQVIDEDGLITPTFAAAAAGGDSFPNDGRAYLEVHNASASPCTVTIAPRAATGNKTGFGPVAYTTQAVVVPITTGVAKIGPFPPLKFNDQSGRVNVTYSAVVTVTVGAFSLPNFV